MPIIDKDWEQNLIDGFLTFVPLDKTKVLVIRRECDAKGNLSVVETGEMTLESLDEQRAAIEKQLQDLPVKVQNDIDNLDRLKACFKMLTKSLSPVVKGE